MLCNQKGVNLQFTAEDAKSSSEMTKHEISMGV